VGLVTYRVHHRLFREIGVHISTFGRSIGYPAKAVLVYFPEWIFHSARITLLILCIVWLLLRDLVFIRYFQIHSTTHLKNNKIENAIQR